MAIERSRIVDEALRLLDEVGIDGLTTRRLAARLGVQQPALYWHFRSKAELLDALAAEILDRYHDRRAPAAGETWDAFTLAHARSFRRALLTVRDGARLFAGTRPLRDQFGDAERQLELYVDAGFPADEALRISITVARFVVGFVLEEQAEQERSGGDEARETGEGLAPFPILSEAITPLVQAGHLNSEPVFESGLDYLLAGFRAGLGNRGR